MPIDGPTPSVHKKALDPHAYDATGPPTAHLSPADRRHSVDFLRLTWDDSRAEPVEYVLHFNATERGTWRTDNNGPTDGVGGYQSSARRTGPPANRAPTTFLVMKAVGNHVVLTMCQTAPRRRLVTITLSRATSPLGADVSALA